MQHLRALCARLPHACHGNPSNQHDLFRMRKIAVLLSGGIDSLIAARILKNQGHAVFGIHFYSGYENDDAAKITDTSSAQRKNEPGLDPAVALRAERLQRLLDVPVEVLDVRQAFQTQVVDYFVQTYQDGNTPNPCMVCNPCIKFGVCLSLAQRRGASHVATGHYVRRRKDSHGVFHLLRGKDRKKDQSYFLARLSQDMLSRSVFPLGERTKAETIALANKWGLVPISAKESQDVCFIHGTAYGEFLAQRPGFSSRNGPIVDMDGQTIGEHQGLHHFTIGQRRGINIPSTEPYYVIRIDPRQNRLVVGSKQDTLRNDCIVNEINWIHKKPLQPIHIEARIRYRHKAAPSRLTPVSSTQALLHFETPQTAVTPGQAAVFYNGDEVLGGGWIG